MIENWQQKPESRLEREDAFIERVDQRVQALGRDRQMGSITRKLANAYVLDAVYKQTNGNIADLTDEMIAKEFDTVVAQHNLKGMYDEPEEAQE